MYFQKEIIINNRYGLHTRAAAIVTFQATSINRKYGVQLFIQKTANDSRIPLSSMLALANLGIKAKDKVIIGYEGDESSKGALFEMEACLTGSIEVAGVHTEEIDRLLDKSTLTSEQLIESISNGIIVVNEDDFIIQFNQAAEKIIGIPKHQVIGKRARVVIEGSKLHEILKTGKKTFQEKQKIGNTTIITNRSPILVNDSIIGAVAIFQDISEIERLSNELDSVKEIKERFGNILAFVNDGICMVDEEGIITYVNPDFERIWNVNKEEIEGKPVVDVLPNSAIEMVMATGKKQLGVITRGNRGSRIISHASPVLINQVFKGVVCISHEETQLQQMLEKLKEAEEKIKYFKDELDRKQNIHEAFEIIIGKSGILRDVLHIASKAAKTSSTLLIHGESGTGKELLAHAIAAASVRKDKPFIRLNCAAIPENLLESELFGHVKGAFTGAIRDRVGKFQLADGGTIFLDEIGDISKEMQVKLLRVLQERELDKVGGTETIKVDVRVIAATNRNLKEMVKEGLFREDLYYRLNVIPITMPPLRKRKGDIPLLVEHFVKKICQREGRNIKKVTQEMIDHLESYTWPGNIRELENIIERAITLGDGDILTEDALPIYIQPKMKPGNNELVNLVNGELMTLEEYEKNIIKIALEKYKSFNRAGKALGITHRTVAQKARKYNLV